MHDPLYKTQMCIAFVIDGFCSKAKFCKYAHGPEELSGTHTSQKLFEVAPAPQSNLSTVSQLKGRLRYKTEICTLFAADGFCTNGTSCLYAHGPEELREPQQLSRVVPTPQPYLLGTPLGEKVYLDMIIRLYFMYHLQTTYSQT